MRDTKKNELRIRNEIFRVKLMIIPVEITIQ